MLLRSFFVSICTASVLCASAQAPFEGIIQFKGETNAIGEKSTVEWIAKNGDSRLNINSFTKDVNSSYSLYFVQGQSGVKMTADGNGKKLVYDVPYSAFANTEFASAFSAEATGQKANIAGYECEEYTVKTSSSVVSCWVSKTTGIHPASFPSVVLGRGVFAVLQRNGVQGIPLKITSRDFAGNVISEQEVVSIQASAVPDQTFAIPAGYEKAN